MNYSTLWSTTLAELELQMSRVMFDSWLRGTTAMNRDGQDGVLEVIVKSAYAQGWLEDRLRKTIERTVARLAGRPLEVQFVVGEEAPPQIQVPLTRKVKAPAGPGFVVPEFDVHEAGFFKIAGYETRFWAPRLGRVAWRVIEIVRETDRRGRKRTDWTPRRRWTAPGIAAGVPCGRQALVGVNRTCEPGTPGAIQMEDKWRVHQDGAFDRLIAIGMAIIERRGLAPHVTYWVSVRNQLGLLGPEQLAGLPSRLQVQHDQWLAEHGFEPKEWDIIA